MPPLLTCVVGRRLCRLPTEDHWALRAEASALLAAICAR